MNIPDQGTGFRPPYTTQFPWDESLVKLTACSNMAHTTEEGTVVEAFFGAELANGDGAYGFGATLVDAERVAWAKFKLVSECAVHDYDPRGRTDGQGWCRQCGQFKHDAVSAAELGLLCHECGAPSFEKDWRGPVCEEHHPGKKYLDRWRALSEANVGPDVSMEELEMIVYYNAASQGERLGDME